MPFQIKKNSETRKHSNKCVAPPFVVLGVRCHSLHSLSGSMFLPKDGVFVLKGLCFQGVSVPREVSVPGVGMASRLI